MSVSWRWRARGAVTVCMAVGLFVTGVMGATGAGALGIYTRGFTGNDISWPQCGGAFPASASYTYGVVGVTSGHAFRANPCVASQYAWATGQGAYASGVIAPEAVYLNLNQDIGTTAANGENGPYGTGCLPDTHCHALNYGYNAASSAHTYVARQVPNFVATMWWFDIETENSWSETDLSLNQDVITGAARYLHTERHFTIGIYSTPAMWQEITGNWQNGLPVWTAGATRANAPTKCGTGFTGGPVYLVQFADGTYDGNYAC